MSPHLTSSPGTGAEAGDRRQGEPRRERKSKAQSLQEADRLGGANAAVQGLVWEIQRGGWGLAEQAQEVL